jgi:hypothetical protein
MTSLQLAASIAGIVSTIIAFVSLFISLRTRNKVKSLEIGKIKSSGIFINPIIGEVNLSTMVEGGAGNDETKDKAKNEG